MEDYPVLGRTHRLRAMRHESPWPLARQHGAARFIDRLPVAQHGGRWTAAGASLFEAGVSLAEHALREACSRILVYCHTGINVAHPWRWRSC